MNIRLSIPYNVFKSKKIEIGLDSYFWLSVSELYRKALLVRPHTVLRDYPGQSTIILPSRIDHLKQLEELHEIQSQAKHEQLRLVVKHHRWKLARFFLLPIPSEVGGISTLTEAVYAEQIAKDILSSNIKYYRKGWLIVEYDYSNARILLDDSVDKIYQWLLKNDNQFKKELNKIIISNKGPLA